MKLSGKIALITGGGTGVGRSVAQLLAAEGAQVIITGRREEKLQEVCATITGEPPARYVKADVADRTQVQSLVNWVNETFGPVDILVNNAGVNIADRMLHQLSPNDWEYVMQVNATGAFNLVHAVLPQMRERADGVIISVASIAGIRPSVLAGAAYNASKHAMTALTKTIGLEEKENGIRATVIHPGEINTPILDARAEPPPADARERMLQPEDVAAAVLFVATLPPRANVHEMVIKPTNAAFV